MNEFEQAERTEKKTERKKSNKRGSDSSDEE